LWLQISKSIIFKVFLGCATLLTILRSVAFGLFRFLAAQKMHNQMIESVLATDIRFFDLNPIGRIMNRFTKDVGNIDDALPLALLHSVYVSVSMKTKTNTVNFLVSLSKYGTKVLGSFAIAFSVNYITIFALAPVAILFAYTRSYYMKSSRETLRIEAICKRSYHRSKGHS
jgi:ATP-binding cassette subfamily C (CFTR/MRP) protein 4